MINFRSPDIEDRKWIKPILENTGYFSSDYAFGSLYIWSGMYKTKICEHEGFLMRYFGNGEYCMPVGKSDIKQGISLLIEDAKERGCGFKISALTEDMVKAVGKAMPNTFNFSENRDIADYIYAVEELSTLSGRKYHGKRNQITQFHRTYESEYEVITEENKNCCLEIEKAWLSDSPSAGEDGTDQEFLAIKRAIDNYKELEMRGAIIKINGNPVAFTIGEEINKEVFITHFEKALPDYLGAYKVINQEFCKNELSSYKYVNREEDLGIEGLRKAKLSYHPAILLNKYSAELR